MRTGTADNRTGGIPLALLGALLVAAVFALWPATAWAQPETDVSASGTQNVPDPRPELLPVFYNTTHLFTPEQLSVLSNDGLRLSRIDIPTVVYVRIADSAFADPQASQQFADAVRDAWGVESAPGADDGMVILVTLDRQGQHGHTLSLSYGDAAFRHSGLTPAYIRSVFESLMQPLLDDGKYYEALYSGMRRIRYGGIYLPPPVPPLTGTQQTVHTTLSWLAPLSVIAISATFIAMSLRTAMDDRNRRTRVHQMAAVAGTVLVVLILLSVYGQSGIGIASALLILLSLVIQLQVWSRPRPTPRPGIRTPAVPPASRRARRLQQARRLAFGTPAGVRR